MYGYRLVAEGCTSCIKLCPPPMYVTRYCAVIRYVRQLGAAARQARPVLLDIP